ncbi:MAG: efflux RND transporter periplasmic adaptor subunit [Planctomycetota bacterium]
MASRLRTVLISGGILAACVGAALAMRIAAAEDDQLERTVRVDQLRALEDGRYLVRLLPDELEGQRVPVLGVKQYPGGWAVVRTGGEGTPRKAPPPAVAVTSIQLEPHDVRRQVLAFGTVEAAQDARVAAEEDGVVQGVTVHLGQAVAKGAPLVLLDPRDAEIAVRRAAAELGRARAVVARLAADQRAVEVELQLARETLETRARELERWTRMAAQGAANDGQVDQARVLWQSAQSQRARLEGQLGSVTASQAEAQATVELAEAASAAAALRRARCTVTAPFAGEVAERLVQVGEHLRAGMPVVRLVGRDRLRVRVHVREEEAACLRAGGAAQVSIPGVAALEGGLEGTVEGVAAASDAATRKVAVDVVIEDPARQLRVGMFARVRLDGGVVPKTYLIPDDAIVTGEDGAHVYVLAGERVRRAPVTLGPRQGEARIHRGGLAGSVELATSGTGLLFDGAPIRRLSGAAAPRAK